MTRLHIHGVGRIVLGREEPLDTILEQSLGRLGDLPIKQYAKPAAYRRFGRVTRLMYVAGMRAVADAKLEDTSALAVVTGTALGEVATSIELLERIHESGGTAVGPALVPGSVHNAPAGHLTIGLGSHAPSLALSCGALSAEAALCAAADLLGSDAARQALVICGDEADPAWVERLADLGAHELAAALGREAFREGAVALVLGREPGERRQGTVAAALRRAPSEEHLAQLLEEAVGGSLGPAAAWITRLGAGGEALAARVGAVLGRDVECRGSGPGVSQAGALAVLADALIDGEPAFELVILGRELDDLGLVHFAPR